MLQIIFGDDEHTASDGPYARLMKTRKWLYLSSAGSYATTKGLYNEEAANSIIKVFDFPSDLVAKALLVGTAYLSLQYIMLMIQLISTYDIVLNDRFVFRRADEIGAERDRVSDLTNKHIEAISEFEKDHSLALAEKQTRLMALVDKESAECSIYEAQWLGIHVTQHSSKDARQVRYSLLRQRAKRALAVRKLDDLEERGIADLEPIDDPRVKSAYDALLEARKSLRHLQAQVPSDRLGYRLSERIIDLARISIPIFASLTTVVYYFWR